jgi:hypothetical protein
VQHGTGVIVTTSKTGMVPIIVSKAVPEQSQSVPAESQKGLQEGVLPARQKKPWR